jgi:hypothetical protein
LRSDFAVRRVVVAPVVESPLAPIVVDEDEPVVEDDAPALCEVDGVLVLPAAVSVDGEVVVLPLVVAPELVPGVAAVEPVLGVAAPVLGEVAVEPLLPVDGPAPVVPLVPAAPPEPEAVPDWAQARPKVPAMAAAMTVMPNLR